MASQILSFFDCCTGSLVSQTVSQRHAAVFSGADKLDDSVRLGQTYTYTWQVRERSGPGPKDPSSVIWIYHSHHSEVQDTNTGLYGAMIISAQVSCLSKAGQVAVLRITVQEGPCKASIPGFVIVACLCAGQGAAGRQPQGHRQGVCAHVQHRA